jgi:hypothetical protein
MRGGPGGVSPSYLLLFLAEQTDRDAKRPLASLDHRRTISLMQVLRELLTPYRGVAFAGFALLLVAVPMAWIEWWPASVPEFAPEGPYYVDGLDLDRHGDTLVLLGFMGLAVTAFGRAGTFLLAAATAAFAIAVILHAWDQFQMPLAAGESQPAEGYYLALAGSGLALAASLAAWIDGLRRQPASPMRGTRQKLR